MKIISIVNNKGGAGKTTITVNLATALALNGYKVGIIDFDNQDQASLGFQIQYNTGSDLKTILLSGKQIDKKDFAKTQFDNLSILQNKGDVTDLFLHSISPLKEGENKILSNKMKIIAGFDFILIDCNPHLGLHTLNALTASTHMLVPTTLEFKTLDGTFKHMAKITGAIPTLFPNLKLIGIVINKYTKYNYIFPNILEQQLQKKFGNIILKTKIRQNIKIDYVNAEHRTVFDSSYAKHKMIKSQEDFLKLADEIINLINY